MLRTSLVVIAGLVLTATVADAGSTGRTFTCRFPQHGLVVIDTREPGSTLTINGHRYAAQGGSYFYYAVNDPDKTVMFKPNMRYWTYKSERSSLCTSQPNHR